MTNGEVLQTLKIIAASLWGITRGLDRIERMLPEIGKQESREMATLIEVQKDIEEMRAEAMHNADVAASATATLRRLLEMIGTVAASASDLDGLRAALDEITATVHDNSKSLGDAIAAVP